MPNSIEIRQTQTYAKWFAALRDIRAKACIDAPVPTFARQFWRRKVLSVGIDELHIGWNSGYRICSHGACASLVLLLTTVADRIAERAVKARGIFSGIGHDLDVDVDPASSAYRGSALGSVIRTLKSIELK